MEVQGGLQIMSFSIFFGGLQLAAQITNSTAHLKYGLDDPSVVMWPTQGHPISRVWLMVTKNGGVRKWGYPQVIRFFFGFSMDMLLHQPSSCWGTPIGWQNRCQMPHEVPKKMHNLLFGYIYIYIYISDLEEMSDRMCQIMIECQNLCQLECWQVCQTRWCNICQNYNVRVSFGGDHLKKAVPFPSTCRDYHP